MPAGTPITVMLRAAGSGDSRAAEALLPLVYQELRSLARSRLAGMAAGQTLQPTALVHEAYLKLIGGGDPGWDGRGHFFASAARAMRDILVDQARRKASLKRGGGRDRAECDPSDLPIAAPSEDVLALDEALKRLEAQDQRKARIVDLRFFAGLSIEETAEVLGVSHMTIKREWRYIKTWLIAELGEEGLRGT